MRLAFLLFVLAWAAVVEPLAAQRVQLGGIANDSTTAALRQILDRDQYILIDRDTTLAEGVIENDVVIVDARVALEGTIRGTVAVIGGDFFPRPGSIVTGRILVVSGGAYPSSLAQTGEVVFLDPRISTALEERSEGYGLQLDRRVPQILRIPGLLGFALPTYDRVDGLSLLWGGGLGFGGDTAAVSVLGTAAYRVERERLHGGVELRLQPTPRTRLSLAASRNTHTNEDWIRGAVPNSLSSVLGRSDVRNYYESDRVAFTLGGLPPPPLIVGEGFIAPRLTIGASEDRTIPTGSPWSLLKDGDPWRPNPAIDEGVIASGTLAALFGWRGRTSRVRGQGSLEWAPSGFGDFDFALLEAVADWWMLGPYNHQIEVRGYLRHPIGSGFVPRQRWTMLGGPGTLPAFPTGILRGDHVALVRSVYRAAVPQLPLPLVGPPTVRLEHAVGTAWAGGADRPPLEQSAGIGLQLLVFTGMVHVDPASSPLDPVFSFGAELTLP